MHLVPGVGRRMRRFGNSSIGGNPVTRLEKKCPALLMIRQAAYQGAGEGIFRLANPTTASLAATHVDIDGCSRQSPKVVTTGGYVMSVSDHGMLRVTNLQSINSKAKWPWHRTRVRFPRMF
jgi:hypothetical protein